MTKGVVKRLVGEVRYGVAYHLMVVGYLVVTPLLEEE